MSHRFTECSDRESADDEVGAVVDARGHDSTASLWNALPKPCGDARTNDLLAQLSEARANIWELIASSAAVWTSLRSVAIATTPSASHNLLASSMGMSPSEARRTLLSTADAVLADDACRKCAHELLTLSHDLLLKSTSVFTQTARTRDAQRLAKALERMRAIEGELVMGNARLVAISVRRLGLSSSEVRDDAMQAGLIGLQEAVRRYDAGPGRTLAAYSMHWIARRIHEARDASNLIRLPDADPQDVVVPSIDPIDDLDEVIADPFTFDATDGELDAGPLRETLAMLPQLQQTILKVAFQLEDTPFIKPEVLAHRLNLPVELIRSQYAQAIQTLRTKLAA